MIISTVSSRHMPLQIEDAYVLPAIVSCGRFGFVTRKEIPQMIPRNCIFIAPEFITKITIFLFQLCYAKLPPNELVLCQLCSQCGDLCFQLTYHFHRRFQSLLQLGFLVLLDIELLCRNCQIFAFGTIQHNF